MSVPERPENQLLRFCEAGSFQAIPLSEAMLCNLVAHIAGSGLNYKVYLAAVRHLHIAEGTKIKVAHFCITFCNELTGHRLKRGWKLAKGCPLAQTSQEDQIGVGVRITTWHHHVMGYLLPGILWVPDIRGNDCANG